MKSMGTLIFSVLTILPNRRQFPISPKNVRVKGLGNVLCLLMFGLLALKVKTLFNRI